MNEFIKSKLFDYKFFGFNKNKKNFNLKDYKKILNKIINDKNLIENYIENGIDYNSFIPLYLKKIYGNDKFIIIYNKIDNKIIIHKKKKYIYFTKFTNSKDNSIIFIYLKEDKDFYLKMIKYYYPYYTYLYKYSKAQLKNIYNKVCVNKNKYNNENNSCYIDSFIYTLFNNKNEIIEKILLNAPINNYNNDLYKKGKEIQEELIRIYNDINDNNNDNDDNDNGNYLCKNLRLLLQKYYNNYIKSINPKMPKIELISSQNDYYEIINVFNIIFKIPDVLEYGINNNIEKRSFVDLFPIDDLLLNDKIEIKNFYPKRINEIIINDGNKIIRHNIEYIKSPLLFIHFNRNYADIQKIDIPIIPSLKIKLRNNKFNLYLNSIIIHIGSNVSNGHYITLYECKGIWYKFDDLKDKIIVIGTFDDILNNDYYLRNIVGLYYL